MDHFRRMLGHAVTRYDRKQAKRKDYNIYALGLYLLACDRVQVSIADGLTPLEAIQEHFTGKLEAFVIKFMQEHKAL
jgi:hypothetical protein